MNNFLLINNILCYISRAIYNYVLALFSQRITLMD